MSEGNSLADAIDMGTDAACGWILDELQNGNSFPEVSEHSAISAPDGGFVNMLVLDIDAYAEKYGNKSIRKNFANN